MKHGIIEYISTFKSHCHFQEKILYPLLMRLLYIRSVNEKEVRLERKLVLGKRSSNEDRRILKEFTEGGFSIYIHMGENKSLSHNSNI